jgi:hypothetical protein
MERLNKSKVAQSLWNALPYDNDESWKVMFTLEDRETASADSFDTYIYGGKTTSKDSDGNDMYLLSVSFCVAIGRRLAHRYNIQSMNIKYIEVFGHSKIIAIYGDKI